MRRRMVRWAAVAVAVPVAVALTRKIADVLEERQGPQSRIARWLRHAADTVRPSR
jgi:hypothetical protein